MNGGTDTLSSLDFSKACFMISIPLPRIMLLAPFTPILNESQTVKSPFDSYRESSVSITPSEANDVRLNL